jgi:hypothetical protein
LIAPASAFDLHPETTATWIESIEPSRQDFTVTQAG